MRTFALARSGPLLNTQALPKPEPQLIEIQFNGQTRQVPDHLTLAALLEWLNLPSDRVAVERNLEIVPRSLWGTTIIRANDRLEVVHFVGGGA